MHVTCPSLSAMSLSDNEVGKECPAQQMAVVQSRCCILYTQCPSFRCGMQLQGSNLQALPEGQRSAV